MKSENKNVGFIRRFHLVPKLLCVIFAFVFWIYVMEIDSPDYEDTFENITVTIVGTTELENSKNLSVFSGYDTLVDVTVRGQKSIISKYKPEDIVVTADVSGVEKSGMYTLELFFDLPSGITFVDSSVSEITMFIDNRKTTDVSVEPRLKGYKLSSDAYALGDVVCDTQIVTVSGPQSVINDIDKAVVEVNLGGEHLTQSLTMDGTIALKKQNDETIESKYLKLSKSTVSVKINVLGYATVPLRISAKNGLYGDDRITVSPGSVRLKGEPAALRNIEYIDLAPVDEKKIGSTTDLTVDIPVPENVYLAENEPTSATVSVNLANFITRTVLVDNIRVINSGDINVQILDEAIEITIMGDRGAVNRVKPENISVVIDYSSYTESTGTINASANVYFDVDEAHGIVYELGYYEVMVQPE